MKKLYKDGVKSVSDSFKSSGGRSKYPNGSGGINLASVASKQKQQKTANIKKSNASIKASSKKAMLDITFPKRNNAVVKKSIKAPKYRDGSAGVAFGKAGGLMGGLGMLGTMAGVATGNEELGEIGASVGNLGGVASAIGTGYENRERRRQYKMGTKGVKSKKGRC
tara:strand:- start:235 stop:732 length:498 start_codon:yes stop_codon:yes gene_type:complete